MNETKPFKLTAAQQKVVDQKLKEVNEYLSTVDLSILYEGSSKPKKTTKS
nr:hypothetical protein [uncultured Dyadobacter sp.]